LEKWIKRLENQIPSVQLSWEALNRPAEVGGYQKKNSYEAPPEVGPDLKLSVQTQCKKQQITKKTQRLDK
jgi:hypothetical protein